MTSSGYGDKNKCGGGVPSLLNQETRAMDKKTIIRYLLDALIAVAVIYGGWSVRQINNLADNQINLEHRVEQIEKVITEQLKTMNDTLTKMVFEQEVQNRISTFKMADRWTATMQIELQDQWFEMLSEIHPDIKHRDLPSIREIQKQYPLLEE